MVMVTSKWISRIPARLEGKDIDREEGCRICGERSAILVGRIKYWDIRSSNIVKCSTCRLIQLDPMPDRNEIEKGCLAYYIEESLRVPEKEQKRNLLRNFRSGILFGQSLNKKKIHPVHILEIGPGSGYFSRGVKFIFPEARITVMDVNSEVLGLNRKQFQYDTIHAVPEDYREDLSRKFHLVIARDILEHVIDIFRVISNIAAYLKPGGVFHFITPNGNEDVWKHYLTHTYLNQPSELLINHLNYFDGTGLKELLTKFGMLPLDYYTYKIKTTLKGRGWKVHSKLMERIAEDKSADYYITQKTSEVKNLIFNPENVTGKWYLKEKRKFLALLVSRYHHAKRIRLSPELNVGHEIYGLFKKT
jgi:SAM-dependent methyltransferase